MPNHVEYPNMLEPFILPNGVLLKNRMSSGPCLLSFGQGPEPFPNEALIVANIDRAKSGASLVPIHGPDPFWGDYNYRTGMILAHGAGWDINDGRCRHPIAAMTQGIHDYQSKALAVLYFDPFVMRKGDYDVSTGIPGPWVYGDDTAPRTDMVECPEEIMLQCIEEFSDYMRLLKTEMGFDGLWTGMGYRHTFLARLLSPITNKRTDKYGGSLENRARFSMELFKRIKEKCGKDFIIEASISGHDPLDWEGGSTLDDACGYAHLVEGLVDILMLRGPTIDETHPIQFHEETPYLYMTEAIKKTNPNVAVETIAGFHNPARVEAALREGKADMVSMARTWISNSEYVKCVSEGRVDDIVPCLKCNKCHRTSYHDPWTSVCSVNPVYGSSSLVSTLIKPATKLKKIAVIGGGPAGMKAAMVASDRGHAVTLYEKKPQLGGLLDVTKDIPFKWPLQRFKQYLIHQVGKRNIQVVCNCEPSKDMLKSEGFDCVIAAVGSSPLILPVPGVDSKHVMPAIEAYDKVDQLADEIVIIGGGEIGIETGIYLGDSGKKVTVLEMQSIPMADASPIHYYIMFQRRWEACENLTVICDAKVTQITDDGVVYLDKENREQKASAGNVILSAGMKPNTQDAVAYYDSAYEFHIIGDYKQFGSVQKVIRNAYYTVSDI